MKRSDNTGSVPHEKNAVHSGWQTGVAVKREKCDMPPFGGIFLLQKERENKRYFTEFKISVIMDMRKYHWECPKV